ncbi:HAMP domain-containing histidine kinase [Alicyclobacillus fastidiosus]|uniref:histidine kinase n=1 Tax=Alicyclobacillus fastidiosus TaxID=392011 RepID=A0ABY6ZK33_9BACL|nr:HAMP domain-containing sensor histidine kinase [Alicyclobacillus fastidiosus]WAH43227.1 HAMP domain-containing histidine kinase [Alicyclobacillus fastidiosus]GMA65263.1 two-component sensor histidine kinase [Alicyclobacillus fastidiosus]
MFKRLRFRITLLSVILLVVLYSITSFAVFAIVRGTYMQNIDKDLQNSVQAFLDAGFVPPRGFRDVSVIESYGAGTPLYWSPELGESLATDINNRVAKLTKRTFINYATSGDHFRILFIPVQSAPGGQNMYLAAIFEDSFWLNELDNLQRIILFVGLFGLVGATLVGFILADRMLRPIRSAWQRQIEFVADASHELRTPLAVIQSNLGIVMEHTDETVTENLEWLNNAHGESRRLSKLVKDLLTLARSDSDQVDIERAPVDLRDLILHVHELYETLAQMKGVHLKATVPVPITIQGDRDRLHQLLVILLDNAMKFTEEGGEIEISLAQQRNTALILVRDTGLGIAKEDLKRVFDRFYTVDPARSREQSSKGTGLGLAIASWVTEAHGGKIGIESDGIGKGTTVHVELPIPVRPPKGSAS